MTQDDEKETGLHQKRTLVFINYFIMRTIDFMNNFADECENKLMDFEYKLQKVEASLLILETKLSSVPSLNVSETPVKTVVVTPNTADVETCTVQESEPTVESEDAKQQDRPTDTTPKLDPAYDKYFKMIQFGVPVEAVKLKVIQEGLDPSVIT